MKVGARHNGFCDPLAMDTAEACAVWVIVDRLTKFAYFLAMPMTFTLEEFYRLHIREIVWLHGVSVSIVSDRDPRFTTHTDRWYVGEDHTGFRRHATSMCSRS